MISNIHKYISLKTTKKNGQEVKTPLWVIQLPQDQGAAIVYAFTNKHSGKIKRLKNNAYGEIALCSFKGKIQSSWSQAVITITADKIDLKKVILHMYKKYSWQMFLVDFLARISFRRSCWVVLKITY